MQVLTYNAKVKHESGLHAAAAARLVQDPSKYTGDFKMTAGKNKYDMKSILGLLSLALIEGTRVDIEVAVSEAHQEAIKNLLENHFELI